MDEFVQVALNLVFDDSDEEEIGEILRRPRFIRKRIPHFDDLDDKDFVTRFRLSKGAVLEVLTLIEHKLEFLSDKNHSVSPINQLLLCLRFFATGSTQLSIGDFSGVSVSTSNRILHRVSRAIASLCKDFIHMPENEQEVRMTQMEFYRIARFPKVIGAIDGTHVKITSPGGDNAEIYRNRKGYFSLNVQAIVNCNLEFLNVVARWPGSANDITIFDQSSVRAQLEEEHFGAEALIVADSGYASRKYMMMPLPNPRTVEESRYNESQIRTRNPVERVFGVWKRRFPVLALGIRTKLERAMAIIVATAVLHNILRRRGEPDAPELPLPNGMPWQELIEFGQMSPNPNPNIPANDPYRQALICNYFRTLIDIHRPNNVNGNQ